LKIVVCFQNIFRFLSHITIVYPKSRNLVTTYPPISGKLSITNYLKQNAIDYRRHMTIENNLKVEISAVIWKTSTTLPPEKTLRYAQWRRQRTIPPKFLAFIVILLFERRCRKQNAVVRFKSKQFPAPNLWAGYAARYA